MRLGYIFINVILMILMVVLSLIDLCKLIFNSPYIVKNQQETTGNWLIVRCLIKLCKLIFRNASIVIYWYIVKLIYTLVVFVAGAYSLSV